MNIAARVNTFKSIVRSFATAADSYVGITKCKDTIYTAKLPPPSYGGRHIVTMVPGIGSGPQMMQYVKDVFEAAYVPVDFEVIEHEDNEDAILSSIQRNGVAIKGHIPTLADTSSNVTLRTHLDLYIYMVHCLSYPSVKTRYPNMDVLIFRQNTEGEYAMLEHESKPGIIESLKVITRSNTERYARWAFEYAKMKNRKKVTVVHKANIMKLTDGLFLKTIKDVARDYPELEVDDMIVDNCCMQMVSHPEKFDVVLTPNLYGNIVTSIICGLIGGPGLISGQNFSDNCAVFECASRHLSFEDEEFVNPVAMLNASRRLLQYLKKEKHAQLIHNAIYKTLVEDKIRTPDIGGTNTGQEMVENIKQNIYKSFDKYKLPTF